MKKLVYLFTPNFNADYAYDHLLYLLGKFNIVMQQREFDLLSDELKQHFKEIEIENQQQQSERPPITELGT